MNKIQVSYISCWDGCENVVTDATLDLKTGIVFNVEIAEVDDDYEMCTGEFIQYEDGTIEEVVEDYFNNRHCYRIVSKTGLDYSTVTMRDTSYIVSYELDKDDISRIFGIHK